MKLQKTIGTGKMREFLRRAKPAVALDPEKEKAAKKADTRRTYLTVPYYTPSDDVDMDNLTDEQKRELIRKGKLMMDTNPITITNIKTRQKVLKDWLGPEDFTYDVGTSYKAWTYTWLYLILTVAAYVWLHPLIAVPLAWKVGHNWGHYIGALVLGKDDMKGKTMYRTV